MQSACAVISEQPKVTVNMSLSREEYADMHVVYGSYNRNVICRC